MKNKETNNINIQDMIYTYPVKVSYDKGDDGYLIHLVDFDQYTDTHFKEAVSYMATDLLTLMIIYYLEDKKELPEPTYHSQDECGEGEEIIYISIAKDKIEKYIKEKTFDVKAEIDIEENQYLQRLVNKSNNACKTMIDSYDKYRNAGKELNDIITGKVKYKTLKINNTARERDGINDFDIYTINLMDDIIQLQADMFKVGYVCDIFTTFELWEYYSDAYCASFLGYSKGQFIESHEKIIEKAQQPVYGKCSGIEEIDISIEDALKIKSQAFELYDIYSKNKDDYGFIYNDEINKKYENKLQEIFDFTSYLEK